LILACEFAISLVLVIYGVFAMSCALDVSLIGVSLVHRHTPDPRRVWSWSRWRRRRQYQARLCHYRRRGYALI
jgi:hypothetical protein